MRAWVVAIAITIGTPAVAAADQFDLVCTGKDSANPMRRARDAVSRYRVDLKAKLWCRDACGLGPDPIAEITDRKIVFKSSAGSLRPGPTIVHEVDRVTGAWTDYWSGGMFDTVGVCEVAAFSGFPVTKTKF